MSSLFAPKVKPLQFVKEQVQKYQVLSSRAAKVQDAMRRELPASHPLRNNENHAKLVEHVIARLEIGKAYRDAQIAMYETIDREFAGFLQLTAADSVRKNASDLGTSLAVYDHKLHAVASQVGEVVTYNLGVFLPGGELFQAQGTAQNQSLVKALCNRLNKDGNQTGLYEQISIGLYNAAKYNLAAWFSTWEVELPSKSDVSDSETQQQITLPGFSGNRVRAVDPYNFFFDPFAEPTEVGRTGEYVGKAEMTTKFNLVRQAITRQLYNIDVVLENSQRNSKQFYVDHPTVKNAYTVSNQSGTTGGQTDWFKYAGTGSITDGMELVTCYIWLEPEEFGLTTKGNTTKKSAQLKCYEIKIINSSVLVSVREIKTPQNRLPVVVTTPMKTNMEQQDISIAEILVPMQNLASFMYNLYQRAKRKELYGVTFYNKRMVNMDAVTAEHTENARIPVKEGWNDPISNGVFNFNDSTNVDGLLPQIGEILGLMQKFVPTEISNNIANMDRATTHQSIAYIRSANRRNQHIAMMIQSQAMEPLRNLHVQNLAISGETVRVTEAGGEIKEFQGQSLILEDGLAAISDGLKAVDKTLLMQMYQNLVGLLVQVPDLASKFDMFAFINYLGSLMGDQTDLTQFQLMDMLSQMTPDQKQAVEAMLQTPEGQQMYQVMLAQIQQAGMAASQESSLPQSQGV